MALFARSRSVGHRLYPVAGGSDREIPGLTSDDQVVRWATDGRALVVGSATSRTLDRVATPTAGAPMAVPDGLRQALADRYALEPLLRMPYYLSPGMLRIDPMFEPVRKNPRFVRLVEGTA